MKVIAVTAAVVVAAGVALAVVVVAGYFYRVPAPEGFEMPRHNLWGGGPAALFTGTVVEQDGCLVGLSEFGDAPNTIVWPGRYHLVVADGSLEVHGDGRAYKVGEHIGLGGGQYRRHELDAVAPEAATRCPEPYFLTTGWAGD